MSHRYREERPRGRIAAPRRRRRVVEACDMEGPDRSRSRLMDEEKSGRPRGRRGRRGLDEEYTDLNLDEILEIEEDEVMEEDMPMEDDMPLEEDGCPPGCAPVEAEDKDEEKEEAEEDESEDEEEEEGEDDEEEKDDEKEASVKKANKGKKTAAKPPVVTAKWAPIYTEADMSRIGKDAEVTLVPFLDQEDPIYVVMANARPVGEIRRSDLGLDDDQLDMFVHETFPKGIIAASEQLGADKVLGDLDVRYYAAQVTQAQADNAAKQAVQADMEEAFQTRSAELKDRFVNNVLLAVEASSKNIFLNNPLRDAIQKNFRQAGIPDTVTTELFETSMQEAGAAYFQAMIKQADEWLGFEKEALVQVEQMVREAGYRHPDQQASFEPVVAATPPVQTMAPRAPQRAAAASTDAWEDKVKNVLRKSWTLDRGRK